MVELAPYNDLPHLVSPVITDVKAATQSLKWAVEEMEKRYKLFAQYHVRNITAFNKRHLMSKRMPKIVIVIDELADLMMMAPQEVEQSIARIAQKRAHVVFTCWLQHKDHQLMSLLVLSKRIFLLELRLWYLQALIQEQF